MILPEDELPPHLYEYDVESLIYVLIWITSRYGFVDGKVRLVEPDAFRDWVKGSRFASIGTHDHALRDAWRRKEESEKQPDHPCMLAHANHQDVIARLCLCLAIHKLNKVTVERFNLDEASQTDRLAPKHEIEVNQKFMEIIEEHRRGLAKNANVKRG
ncbi:hypothetical protein BDY19DRAFT_647966 [Irpex rosettiformis]|uniref:Uncharacterized protein n=1 Tax=Irpex rosettiformis TaxID=378272 RepID=A0ACB8TNL7_9APHY|nr:hypothetical protein BDY19DRAFT_647966 [Irpex rosettiformis]